MDILRSGLKFINLEEKKEIFPQEIQSQHPFSNTNLEEQSEKSSHQLRENLLIQSIDLSNEINAASGWGMLGLTPNPLYPLTVPQFQPKEQLDWERLLNDDGSHEADVESSRDTSDGSEDGGASVFREEKEDDQDHLNRGLEVPLSDIQPTFTQDESLENITKYLSVSDFCFNIN